MTQLSLNPLFNQDTCKPYVLDVTGVVRSVSFLEGYPFGNDTRIEFDEGVVAVPHWLGEWAKHHHDVVVHIWKTPPVWSDDMAKLWNILFHLEQIAVQLGEHRLAYEYKVVRDNLKTIRQGWWNAEEV